MASSNYVLRLYQKFKSWPFGNNIFSAIVARKAPYFATIKPLIKTIEPNYCEVLLKKRRAVENHIGTVHVIAICNALEMAMGTMAEASIPKHLRWIPKGMSLDYVAKAATNITATASVQPEDWKPGDLFVSVIATDINGQEVVTGTIKLWISEKPVKQTGSV